MVTRISRASSVPSLATCGAVLEYSDSAAAWNFYFNLYSYCSFVLALWQPGPHTEPRASVKNGNELPRVHHMMLSSFDVKVIENPWL